MGAIIMDLHGRGWGRPRRAHARGGAHGRIAEGRPGEAAAPGELSAQPGARGRGARDADRRVDRVVELSLGPREYAVARIRSVRERRAADGGGDGGVPGEGAAGGGDAA